MTLDLKSQINAGKIKVQDKMDSRTVALVLHSCFYAFFLLFSFHYQYFAFITCNMLSISLCHDNLSV